jgi:hypothetical protein
MTEYRYVEYETRDLGYGSEYGVVTGYWAERDWTGKREFVTKNGICYLFDDEVKVDMPVERRQYAVMVYVNVGSSFNPIWKWVTDSVYDTEAEACWELLTPRIQQNNDQFNLRTRVVEWHSAEWKGLVQ